MSDQSGSHRPGRADGRRPGSVSGRTEPASNRSLHRWTSLFWAAFTVLDIVKDHLFKDLANAGTWNRTYIITTDSIIFWGSWGLLAPLAYWLVERHPAGRHGMLRFGAIQLAAALAVGFFHLMIAATLFQLRDGEFTLPAILNNVNGLAGGFLLHDVVVYWGLAAVCIAWTRSAELRRQRVEGAELESMVARLEAATMRARLAALRRQLDPHFLFNALNAASGLARRGETRRVTAMLARLGDLLRSGLAEDESPEIPLAKELRWLDLYFAIEKERFQDRLAVRTEVPGELHAALVPALILQPLVENAVRHGIGPDGVGRVTVSGSRDDGRLVLVVQDSGAGIPDHIRDGVGLANTRERLSQLYGEAGVLRFDRNGSGGARAVVELPWHTDPIVDTGAAHD